MNHSKVLWILLAFTLGAYLVHACGPTKPTGSAEKNSTDPDGGQNTNTSPNNNTNNTQVSPGPESIVGEETSTTPESSSGSETAAPQESGNSQEVDAPEAGPEPISGPESVPDIPPTTPEIEAPEPTTPEQTPESTASVPQELRFIAIGDTGTGSATQKAVAQAIDKKCKAEAQPGGRGPCDFGIMLGDNFYDVGVSSATDSQFKTKFADMYHPLGFPMYTTIGNHDYGAAGTGLEFWKSKFYLDYAKADKNFIFPDVYYSFVKKHVTFVSLNTAELFFEYNLRNQVSFVQQAIASAKTNGSVWTIVFGHHPYISNGVHGNAGQYEGIPIPIPFVSGVPLKKFFEAEICNKVDLYLCGHDHNRQILHDKCGVKFIVSGAGAKATKFGDPKRNPVYWQKDTEGFLYVHIKDRTMTTQFFDEHGTMEYEKIYTK